MWKLTIDPGKTQEKHGFRLGDRVVFIEDMDEDGGVVRDCRGTVCDLDVDRVGVRWDTFRPGHVGHACDGACDDQHGWYVDHKSIVHEIPEEPISMDSGDLEALMGMIQ